MLIPDTIFGAFLTVVLPPCAMGGLLLLVFWKLAGQLFVHKMNLWFLASILMFFPWLALSARYSGHVYIATETSCEHYQVFGNVKYEMQNGVSVDISPVSSLVINDGDKSVFVEDVVYSTSSMSAFETDQQVDVQEIGPFEVEEINGQIFYEFQEPPREIKLKYGQSVARKWLRRYKPPLVLRPPVLSRGNSTSGWD